MTLYHSNLARPGVGSFGDFFFPAPAECAIYLGLIGAVAGAVAGAGAGAIAGAAPGKSPGFAGAAGGGVIGAIAGFVICGWPSK